MGVKYIHYTGSVADCGQWTSCASKVHRASGSGRGKPVLICILACSLGFHAITLERGTFTKFASFKMEPV